jgi:4-amino-4-deoxy-L-arabinose transferase-like glycosyltransferase
MRKGFLIKAAIIAACVIFFSFRAGDISAQFTGDENFYYQSAKGMIETGDWMTPRYYGEERFQKPILYYWFIAVSFRVFGVGWYAARFPSILFAAFTVLMVYLIAMTIFKRKRFAIFSALLLACTFKFFKYARFAIPDMTLLFFITSAFFIFMKIMGAPGKKRRLLWPAFSLALALGTMTKGPIAVLIPAISIAVFRIFSKKPIPIKARDIAAGISVYLAVTLPWFIAMYFTHGHSYLSHLWTRELAGRVENHGITRLFFYVPIIIMRFLPWSLLFPRGLARSIKYARRRDDDYMWYGLILSWFFTVFVVFSLMGEKHSQYMLALTVPFSLIVGAGFSLKRSYNKKMMVMPIALVLLAALSFLSFLSNKEFKLNSAILGNFASSMVEDGLGRDDKIGAGSHDIIPQQFEVYTDRTVEKVSGRWADPEYHERTNRSKLEKFFDSGDVYCIISGEDLERYVPEKTRKRLRVVHKEALWKRKVEFSMDNLNLLLTGKMADFLGTFRKEYYLVTNK